MMHFIDTIVEPSLWFLADWSFRWALLIGVAALVLLVFRPRRAATHQVMLLTALLGGLLLPVAPRWGSGLYAPPNDTLAPPMVPAPGIVSTRRSLTSGKSTVEVHETPSVAPTPAASDRAEDPVAIVEAGGSRAFVAAGVALCWSAGVVALLLRWNCGWWFLRRLRRRRRGDARTSSGLVCGLLHGTRRARRRAIGDASAGSFAHFDRAISADDPGTTRLATTTRGRAACRFVA